jgi:hypothetical protein
VHRPASRSPALLWRRLLIAGRRAGAGLGLLVLLWLATADPALAADPTIQGVIDRLRLLLVGLLAGLTTLALTVGGVRYLAAGGDPGEIQKAKTMFKAAAVGYGIAALAPALVGILRTVVGA